MANVQRFYFEDGNTVRTINEPLPSLEERRREQKRRREIQKRRQNRKRKAMICVGTHPTVNQLMKPIIEVHIIDFNEVLYGREIYVDFVSFMRNNKKFDSLEDLRAQLIKDEEKTKNTLQ
jgi:riboflavin kinase/FMN adenylyltransferase